MMSLSHFDEKSGIVPCLTPWGQWYQTVSEVFIDVSVPEGTRGKECTVTFKTDNIECKVKGEVIFQGDLFDNVVVDDCTWTLEEQNKISILLTKSKKFTTDNLWESLLSDEYAPDPFVREQMLKKLDLEKMQSENASGDEASSPKDRDDDEESVASASGDEAEENNEQAAEPGSDISAPASPAGSDASEHSEDEVHISEGEGSNHGSDAERAGNDSESEAEVSGNEAENDGDEKAEEEDVQDSDHEGSVPEINIQSEDEEKADSDDEVEMGNQSDAEKDQGPSSPAQEEDEEEMAVDKTVDSDNEAEESSPEKTEHKKEEEHDEASDTEGKEYGNLVANIFGDSDDEDGSPEKGESPRKAMRKSTVKRKILSDSEDEGEKSEAEEQEVVEHAEDEEKEQHESDAEVDKEEDKIEDEVVPDEEIKNDEAKGAHQISDDDSDEGVDDKPSRADFISDFDLMMQKKKEESSRKRKRKDVDIINDSDDLIADIISRMRVAADEDRQLNKAKSTATKKLKILSMVMSQLKKQDMKMAFLDQGVLNVIADWLSPLPDRSLPNLKIREGMIKRLGEFPYIDQSLLKSSGVGRALMYLYKHPKETKENKERAGKLITEWARPIFNVTTDYHALTKEEREQRDFDHIPRKKRNKDDPEPEESPEKNDIDKALREGDRKIRPGEKGWIGRARVPLPSTRDYVVRPKWNVEMEFGRGPGKKPLNRFEKHMRTLQEKKRNSKALQAVTISIEGRKMAI